ncbi:MAG: FkbM family methyltransferase [Phycisphaerales bacterium]
MSQAQLQDAYRLFAEGRLDEAAAALGAMLRASPTSVHALALLGAIHERRGEWDRALAVYEASIRATPGNAAAFTRRAVILMRRAWGPPTPPRPPTPGAAVITMTDLGANGRFGNQLLQYGFLRMYAAEHGLEVHAPDWMGRDLYDLDDPFPVARLARVNESETLLIDSLNRRTPRVFLNVDVTGYFCGDTSGLARHRDLFRGLFQPGRRARPLLDDAMGRVRAAGSALVAVHLRRGDFVGSTFWIAPAERYRRWLSEIWPGLDRPVLYIASDDPGAATEFAEFRPLTAASLGIDVPGAEFFVDFHVLSRADCLAVSNSSFSFVAAMLNTTARDFVRPTRSGPALIRFDPWNAPVLLEKGDAGAPAHGAPSPAESPESLAVARAFVGPTARVVVAGSGGESWVRALGGVQPSARVLRWTPHTPGASLDDSCTSAGIRHIQLLRIASGARVPDVAAGAPRLLGHARIDAVLFGGPGAAAATPADADLLRAHGYEVLVPRVESGQLALSALPPGAAVAGELLAIHERLIPHLRPGPKAMLDLVSLLPLHGVTPRGVIQLGAHEGEELETWGRLGVQRALLVEANPAVYQRLLPRTLGLPGVRAVNCAVSDHVGRITLRLASGDQSSSILPMARHLDIYPGITEVGTVEVPCTTLDQLLADLGLPAEGFNILSLDIQGAELLALRGAEAALRSIEAINVEVNFDELYRGAPQIEDIDGFLAARGFARVALTCPFHPTWGDALYTRARSGTTAAPTPPSIHPDWLSGGR